MIKIIKNLEWDIICTGNEIMISDTSIKIKELYGGFGQGQKILTVQQIALLHADNPNNKNEIVNKIKRINELINRNDQGFINNIDVIDLKKYNVDFKKLKQSKIYTQAQIGNSKHLYILSITGYCKLYNTMRIKNYTLKNKIIKEYFIYTNNIINIDDSIIYKEIDFKNTYEHRIGIILKNIKLNNKKIEETIKNKYYIAQHQYSVCNNKYKIDFFFKELKIIVEYDEDRHKYQQEEDKQRMNEIIQFLLSQEPNKYDLNDYIVLRIKENDKDGVDKVIGTVLNRIAS